MANLRTRRPRLDPDSFIAAAEAAAETAPASLPEPQERKPAPTARAGQGRGEPLPWQQPGGPLPAARIALED